MIRSLPFFFLLLFFLSSVAQASVFVNSGSKKRSYIEISYLGETVKLTTFSQLKGEEAYVVNLEYLHEKELPGHLDKITKNYQFQKQLESWSPSSSDKDFRLLSFFPWGKKAKPIWTAKNKWNKDWEEKFGQWIENEVDVDFFKRYNIATDCADAVVGLRWIFARLYSLPVANSVNNSTSLFGNFTIRKSWKNLSTAKNWYEDELFKTALEYVMDMSTTRTITQDGYPVSLDKNGLKAGVFIVTQNVGGGHVSMINSANWEDDTKAPLIIMASTLPRKVRSLKEEIYMEEDWPEKGYKDILAFKWPEVKNGEWQLVTPQDGFYSLDQYDRNLKLSQPNFIKYLLENIKGNFNPHSIIQKMMDDLYDYVELRVDLVKTSFEYCAKNTCAENSEAYHYWSTFNRDSKIISKFTLIESMVNQYAKLDEGLVRSWNRFLSERFLLIENVEVNFYTLQRVFTKNEYSSDPNDSVLKRWGLNFQEKIDEFSSRVKTLFAKRVETIKNQDQNCDESCVPGNLKWLAYSTYPEDKELNQIYTTLMPLCKGSNEVLCRAALNGSVKLQNEEMAFFDLMRRIPFFNSDPRAPLELRWGAKREGVQTKILPYFEFITIAKNELALLDERLLIDLRTQQTLYKAKSHEKLYLSSNGNAFLKEGNLNLYLLKDKQKIKLPLIVAHSFELEVISSKERDYLRISEEDSCLYEIAEQTLKFVTCALKNYKTLESSLYLITENDVQILKDNAHVQIELSQLLSYKLDTHFLNVVDASENQLLFTYESKDEDRYEIYIFQNQELKRLEFPSMGKIKLKRSFLKEEVIFFMNDFSAEYPEVYLYDLKNKELIKLQNDVDQFVYSKEEIYYAVYEGSQWQSQRLKSLYRWDNVARVNSKRGSYNQIQAQGEFLYLSNSEKGEVLFPKEQKNFLHSKDLTLDFSCKNVFGKGNNFVYLFDYLYGDYLCHGGIYSKNYMELSSKHYPLFTTYSWFNAERMKDQIWLSNKENQKIDAGQVIFFGPENAFWFQEGL